MRRIVDLRRELGVAWLAATWTAIYTLP